MRILVADDERELLDITVKRLKAQGYAVDGCDNGDDAAYYLEQTPYDLAILDIMMPGRDGLSILRGLRAAGRTLPVLLLTALDAVGDRVSGLDAGADDYLTKPFAFDELLARIRVLLRRGGRSDHGAFNPHGPPRGPGDYAFFQGVCNFRISAAQQGRGALSCTIGKPCLGLRF